MSNGKEIDNNNNNNTDRFWIAGSDSKEDGEETERCWNRYELGGYAETCNPELCTNSSNGSGKLRRLVATSIKNGMTIQISVCVKCET